MNDGEAWWSKRMVVPQRAASMAPTSAGEVDRLLVERAVEPPPHLLQDLDEAPRRLGGTRHPAREGAVEVGVGVDEAGQHERALEVQDLLARGGRERRAALDDPLALDAQAGPLHLRRVEGRDGRVLQEHGRHPSGRSRRWSARAASSGGRLHRLAPGAQRGPDVLQAAAGEHGEGRRAAADDPVGHRLAQAGDRGHRGRLAEEAGAPARLALRLQDGLVRHRDEGAARGPHDGEGLAPVAGVADADAVGDRLGRAGHEVAAGGEGVHERPGARRLDAEQPRHAAG